MTEEADQIHNFHIATDLNIKLEYLPWFYIHKPLEKQNLSHYGKNHLNEDTFPKIVMAVLLIC